MLKRLSFFLVLFYSTPLLGQNIPLGTWRNHADYSNAEKVVEFSNKVFCATANGLFYFDKEDGSLNTVGTTDGLSSTNISMLEETGDNLLIGYEDGLLDRLDSELNLTRFDELFQSELTTSKRINEAVKIGNIIYLATDFGVVLYNPVENDLIDVFLDLGVSGELLEIHGISTDTENLYLSTDEGLLVGNLTSNLNLKDFQNWKRVPVGKDSVALESTVTLDNQLFALAENDSIYIYETGAFSIFYGDESPIKELKQLNENLYIASASNIKILNNNQFEVAFSIPEGEQINDFTIANDQVYAASQSAGLVLHQAGATESLIPQGPVGNTSTIHQIEQFTFHLAESVGGFSYFENGRWNQFKQTEGGLILPVLYDVALDLTTGNGIFLSKEEGLFSWDTETISPLNINVPTVAEWVSLSESPQGSFRALVKTGNDLYAIYNPESEEVKEMNLPVNSTVNDYLIAPNGDHYLATTSGIFVFNEESGEERRLNSVLGNGNLPSNNIRDLALDLDGQLWIATVSGAAFFNSYQGVLQGENVDASQPIFDGFFLFDGIPVNHISIDGGNRKWMSTRDGLWLFDQNIERNILHLRRENSPIVDNNIRQMVVNPLNGELFFSSESQFLSYRTDATRAGIVHSDVEVFPNPVSISGNQRVTVRGLAYNSEVKITDMAGNLIHKGDANGGTFSWELSNYSGFRIKSGVYLVFSISADGTESYQTKFAVLP